MPQPTIDLSQGLLHSARSRHLKPDGSPRFVNRLVLETSPYLLQHAHNPVEWQPWGDEAFALAQAQDKLVLLSVGYSTCHWCHVMERESFEDLEVAARINADFIAVKVDREERPDVDAVYMQVLQALTGGGGWPMTFVLTPDREPVFAGTYLPPRDGERGADVGLLTVLGRLAEMWRESRSDLAARGRALVERFKSRRRGGAASGVPSRQAIERVVEALDMSFDPTYGGFGEAPKFPRPVALELLLRSARWRGDERPLRMVEKTLEGMAQGGIADQVGGGFHRYSIDDAWLVPHFEKMLYDNAQLAVAYLEAFQATGRRDFAEVARGICDYVRRDLRHPAGGFFSATDADSRAPDGELEEGRFFTWTPSEIALAVGEEAAPLVCAAYGVVPTGHVDGRSVLHRERPLTEIAADHGCSVSEVKAVLARAGAQLLAAREGRPPPSCDTRIITSWNGLMISAFVKVGVALAQREYIEVAREAAAFVWEHLQSEGRLRRAYAAGESRHTGFLDDYAFFIQALLDLFEATGDLEMLTRALALQGTLDAHFADAEGGYFFTADDEALLLWRDQPAYDGAEPCGNSVAALNLLRLRALTLEPRFTATAERLLRRFADTLESGVALPKMLTALDFYLDATLVVSVVKARADEDVSALLSVLGRTFAPNRVVTITCVGPELEAARRVVPSLATKTAQGDRAAVYLCQGEVCIPPVATPAELEAALVNLVEMWSGVD